MINAPQGSVASDIQQVEDLNDNDRNSELDQPPIINDMTNLHLDDVNFSSNAYQHRYFDLFH
jgi:hypothetical protein